MWISVHDNVIGGKLRKLAKEIGCSQNEALGLLIRLWLWGLNNADKALEYSELYMQKNPNATPSDYAKMAQIYVEKKDFSKALGIYDKMAEKFPQITGWTYMIASSVADKSGNTELGAAYNQKIIDMLGNKADRDEDETGYLKQALRLIGYYYWSEKNDLEKAKPYYEMLIKIDPNDGNAKAALGIE